MPFTKDPRGRVKPAVVSCRITQEKKQLFYEKVKSEDASKRPANVLEELIDQYLNGG
jgi:hypothetical protein